MKNRVSNIKIIIPILSAILLLSIQAQAVTYTDNFDDGNYTAAPAWTVYNSWAVQNMGGNNRLVPTTANSGNAVINGSNLTDFTYELDVLVANQLWAKAGPIFRVSNLTGGGGAFRGYFATLEIAPDRVRLILFRIDNGPWVNGPKPCTAAARSPPPCWRHPPGSI
jgi:hypothetical protein